jgi:hypothetical protein
LPAGLGNVTNPLCHEHRQLAFHDIQMGSSYTKAIAMAATFRSYELSLDAPIVIALGAVLALLAFRGRFHVSRTLRWPLLSLAILYVLAPQFIFGSEMTRLSLSLVLLAIAASRVEWSPRVNRAAVVIVIVLTLVKIGAVVYTWSNVASSRTAYLQALDRVPAGAKLFTVVFHDREPWSPLPEALEHLCSVAVRRGVFVPTMFVSAYPPASDSTPRVPIPLSRWPWVLLVDTAGLAAGHARL